MKTILFQGDSITDAGRIREKDSPLAGTEHASFFGYGYANYVCARLGFDFPTEYKFINRGIGGNRTVDVYARIKKDIINLAPDYMSLLIGVNDVWHELESGNGVSAEKFEKIYTMLLEEIYEALPNIKIMLLEPFVLEGPSTMSKENHPGRWPIFDREVKLRAAAAKRVAEKFGIPFVTLQDKFDAAVARTNDTTKWAYDGVHPTPRGHEIIARAWLEAFATL